MAGVAGLPFLSLCWFALLSPSYTPDGGVHLSCTFSSFQCCSTHNFGLILSFTDFCSVFPRFSLSSLSSRQYFCQNSLVSVLLELPLGGEQGKETPQVQVLRGCGAEGAGEGWFGVVRHHQCEGVSCAHVKASVLLLARAQVSPQTKVCRCLHGLSALSTPKPGTVLLILQISVFKPFV